MAAAEGFDPRLKLVPVAVIDGGVTSTIHVAVRDAVAVLPQESVAVNVLLCDLKHAPTTGLSDEVNVNVPQAFIAVAEPRAASIAAAVGLHPTLKLLPVAMMVKEDRSSVQVTVRDVVAVLPQASVAVNVLVCERVDPLV